MNFAAQLFGDPRPRYSRGNPPKHRAGLYGRQHQRGFFLFILLTLNRLTGYSFLPMRKLPGRPMIDGKPASQRFLLCLTEDRKRAYQRAAADVPLHLWAKRLLDREAKYKP